MAQRAGPRPQPARPRARCPHALRARAQGDRGQRTPGALSQAREPACAAKGGYGDFKKLQPCKSNYTTTQNTYQTCPKRPR
eukprot:4864234-Prymnesium_polylepis.1